MIDHQFLELGTYKLIKHRRRLLDLFQQIDDIKLLSQLFFALV